MWLLKSVSVGMEVRDVEWEESAMATSGAISILCGCKIDCCARGEGGKEVSRM